MNQTTQERLREVLAQLVWEFTLIKNGLDLNQHTLAEAGKLERAELKATEQAILQLIETEIIGEDEKVIEKTTPSQLRLKYSEQFIVEAQARDNLRQQQRTTLRGGSNVE